MQINQDYHKMLKSFRKKANMTQEDIAFELNMPQSTISKIEGGTHVIDIQTFVDWVRVTNSEINAIEMLFDLDEFKVIQHEKS